MVNVKKLHHLNVFLMKDGYEAAASVIKTDECQTTIDIPIAPDVVGCLFVRMTQPTHPKWATLFASHINLRDLEAPGVSAAFFIRAHGHSYVLAFGTSGRHLLRHDVFEERFGLLCALNSVDPDSLRCVDVQSLDAIQSHKRIQSGQEVRSDQFGLDVEQDMLKAIVGKPIEESLGGRMTGSDSLTVSVKLYLSDLPALLERYRLKFRQDLSSEDHQWVTNISQTKSAVAIEKLEAALDAKLAADDLAGIWLSIPQIIQWDDVAGFMYSGSGRKLHSDISLEGFRKSIKSTVPLSIELLRKHDVHCADSEHHKIHKSWPVYRCLYAEIDLDGAKYILNDGKWFSIGADFEQRTNEELKQIPYSTLAFSTYKGGGEGAFNKAIAEANPTQYFLLDDKQKISHGGGHGQVEVCDLLSINRELIHVKIYGRSSVLSHLFAQGFVSGQLIQIDSKFRAKVRGKLTAPFVDLLNVDTKPAQDEFTIVYAIISAVKGSTLHLPFFSRVNLNNTAKILRGFGYKVQLLRIDMDEEYAKTIKGPPPKPKSSVAKKVTKLAAA